MSAKGRLCELAYCQASHSHHDLCILSRMAVQADEWAARFVGNLTYSAHKMRIKTLRVPRSRLSFFIL